MHYDGHLCATTFQMNYEPVYYCFLSFHPDLKIHPPLLTHLSLLFYSHDQLYGVVILTRVNFFLDCLFIDSHVWAVCLSRIGIAQERSRYLRLMAKLTLNLID
jgi:hypothetical protein